MTRVLFVAMDATPYGDKSHEVRVAETIARAGHQVHLVCERVPRFAQVPVQVEPVNVAEQAESIASRLGTDYDLAFASSASGAPIVAAWKAKTGKTAVCQILDAPAWRWDWGDGAPWLRQWTPWYRALLKCDRLVANMQRTAYALRAYAPKFGARSEDVPPIDVLYYGIDTDAADAAQGNSVAPMRSMNAARLVPYKGFDLAIQALALVDPKLRPVFDVVGEGEDGPRLLQLTQWTGMRVNEAVVFHGGIGDRDKFNLIKKSSFGLSLSVNPDVPSQYPLESVYSGRPCIVADLPINRDRYGACPDGLRYVNAWDTGEVADAVLECVRDAPKVSDAARAWILEHRSFHSHAASIMSALAKVKT